MTGRTNSATTSSTAPPDPFERVTVDGTEYLVAPVVAQREDVYAYRINGETRREYLPGEELTAPLDAWDGTPLVLRHPDPPGPETPALLSEPGVVGRVVGSFRDAKRTNGSERLAGRVYIRPDELGEHDGDLRSYVERVRRTGVGEVSTGYDVGRLEQQSGRHNGTHYQYIQRDIRPDHLALLPDRTGNCPVDGGVCGVGRANANGRTNHRVMRANATYGEQKPMDIPDEYIFENPGQAIGKAEEMGLDGGDIHEHETDDGSVFMPGASHASLLAHLRDEGVIDDAGRENARHGIGGDTDTTDDGRVAVAISVGEKVTWSTAGRNWYGIVREVRTDADAEPFASEIDGTGTVTPPAARIEEYLPADRVDDATATTKNGWAKTGTMVAHTLDTDTLSAVDAFPQPGRVNAAALTADDPLDDGEDWWAAPTADDRANVLTRIGREVLTRLSQTSSDTERGDASPAPSWARLNRERSSSEAGTDTATETDTDGSDPGDESTTDEPAESGATTDDTASMKDDDKIDTLVSDHGFDRHNLEPLKKEDCLDRIHSRFVDTEPAGTDGTGTETTTTTETETETETQDTEIDVSDVDDLVAERVNEAVSEAVDAALDDQAGDIADRVDEARQNEQHIQMVAESDDYPLDRDELETMAPDAVAKLAETVDTDDGEAARANFAGIASGPSFEATGDTESDDALDSIPAPGARSLGGTEGDD